MTADRIRHADANILVFGNIDLPKGTLSRPLVTFAIFAYNQEQFIREAVEGAFSQDYEPLEIIISDDGSSDLTFEIAKDLAQSYKGMHKIIVRKNIANLGLAQHVNSVLDSCDGEIVVIGAGDDISYPNRVMQTVTLFQENPSCTAVLVSSDIIDSNGSIIGEKTLTGKSKYRLVQQLDDLLSNRAKTFGASRAIKKDLWDSFPALSAECPTEDTPLLLRSLLCGSNILSASKCLAYRSHETNLSTPASLSLMNIDAIISQYQSDISHALRFGMIKKKTYDRLLQWTGNQKFSRTIQNKLLLRQPLSIKDLLHCLFASSLSLKCKAKLLQSLIAKILNIKITF